MNYQSRIDLSYASNGARSLNRTINGIHAQMGAVFAMSLAYATIRYHVFKGVAWADWPTYTVNKALAVSALVLLFAGLVPVLRRQPRISGPHLRWAGGAIIVHVILSLLLLGPAYYPKFFDDDKLTVSAGLSLLLGVVAATTFVTSGQQAVQWSLPKKRGWTGFIAFIGGCHAALPGWGTWLQPLQWPALMPPITLIAFLLGTASGAFAIAGLPRKV